MIPFKRYCPETYTDLTDWVTHSLTYFDCYPLTLWKIQNIKYKNQYERNSVNDNALKLLSTNWKDHAGLCFSSAELLTVLPYWATFDVSWNHRMLTLNTGHAGLSSQRNYTATERRWKWSPKKMTETWTRLRRHQWPHQMIPRTVTRGPLRRQVG